VLTDLEFYELRYAGKSAAFVRGFRAIYLGLFFNCVIMATVTLAAAKIANVMLGWDRLQTVLVCGAICIVFSALSGLWGVLASDIIQFVIAMVGVFAAAYFALGQPEVGGLAGLIEKVEPATLSMLPDFNNMETAVAVLIIPLAVQWWSVWYPGAEPGGGSYIAQRMLAAKDEKHSMAATLWFNVAHYALRPWPWIIVALCSILVFPELKDIQKTLPHVSDDLIGNDLAYPAMLTLMPHGLLGLLVASLLSAYVSTMSTHLNWGSSYLVHDFYRRFIKGDAGERHYVWVSRLTTAGLMVLAAVFMFLLSTAGEAFNLMLSIGAGTGLIYLLRWFWWRINAWSEITAMFSSFFISFLFFFYNKLLNASETLGGLGTILYDAGIVEEVPKGDGIVYNIPSSFVLITTVAATTIVWFTVTLLTHPASRDKLVEFYKLVRPAGPGWRDIRKEANLPASPDSLPQAFLGWFLGCVLVYSALFGAGSYIYGSTAAGIACTVVFACSGIALAMLLTSMWSEKGDR
jgi:Na+/proline symporter